ncbi:MAG: 1,4-dihydroxy-2-naphthoate polyprenyltransferase [Actinomycetota bacterium]|nr:1,4-dihydroxy-2-naphthoate polyprenyltransferase [Actinomycetota bacterium]
MTAAAVWLAGARPRTLPAAVVPVAVGTGAAAADGSPVWWRVPLALLVALALQVGVNYANDYSDGIRGTDTDRVGPLRLVGSGTVPARHVLLAALTCFAIAALAGLVLAAVTSWWLVVIGAAAIGSAWFYTGGPVPYGYRALGELAVFVFFGAVAVIGTSYVLIEAVTWTAVVASVPIGLLACALLVVNNLRDLDADAAAGKRTLAVLVGDHHTRELYTALMLLPFPVATALALRSPFALLCLAATPVAVAPVRRVLMDAVGRELVDALRMTGRAQLAFGLLLAVGLAIG